MTEGSTRPDPGFDVIIKLHNDPANRQFISPRLAAALQDVYDIAVNSLDFGSGFLSTDEVMNLRELGQAIGADPLHYNCAAFYNGGAEKVYANKTCTCGITGTVDGEVVADRTQLEASTPALEA